MVSSRILKFTESNGLYEIAHDSLALTIAEKRTDEDIAILEIKRLIKSHTSLSTDASEFLSEKQLNLIEPYFQQLELSPTETDLVEDSRRHLANQKRKKKIRLIIGFSIIMVALVVMSGLFVYALQQQKVATNEKEAAEKARADAEKAEAEALENLENFIKEKAERKPSNLTWKRAKIIEAVQGCPEELSNRWRL